MKVVWRLVQQQLPPTAVVEPTVSELAEVPRARVDLQVEAHVLEVEVSSVVAGCCVV